MFKIAPAGTKDFYAAGYDGNRFATRAEAAAAIGELRRMGGEWDIAWDVVELPVYAAIGTDGSRYVVWGLGDTEEAAEAEARAEAGECDPELCACVRVNAERAARIEAGDVSADDLVTRETKWAGH